jgi:hypothetical protein
MDGSTGSVTGQVRTVPRSGEPAAQEAEPQRSFLRRLFGRSDELRIYQHSNLAYWWVLWAYGYFCAILTYAQGIGVRELASGAEKVVLFHPSPLLGISYIGLILFVAVFTNVRLRGVHSLVLVMVAVGLLWVALRVPGVDVALGWLQLLRVHLNLAFYVTFSTLLLLIWTFGIVFVDHFTWWRFSPGQVVEEHMFGQATGHAYNTEMMVVRRLPNDLFRHVILGLGTGDFEIKPAHGAGLEIHNVWRARKKQRLMEDMISRRVVETAKRKT